MLSLGARERRLQSLLYATIALLCAAALAIGVLLVSSSSLLTPVGTALAWIHAVSSHDVSQQQALSVDLNSWPRPRSLVHPPIDCIEVSHQCSLVEGLLGRYPEERAHCATTSQASAAATVQCQITVRGPGWTSLQDEVLQLGKGSDGSWLVTASLQS